MKITGLRMAARVPKVLLHPIRIAACLGAMSSRLAFSAELAEAELARARPIPTMAGVELPA